MTHSCCHFPVGYRGQKYQVEYKDHYGTWHVFGWQNNPIGGLTTSLKIWPSALDFRIVEVPLVMQAAFIKHGTH